MNKIDEQVKELMGTILKYGTDKSDRTGTGTKSIFGYTIRHKMSDGFPLLTTKRVAIKTMMTELKWFLKGDTNIKYLIDNGCNIWNGDVYKSYRTKMQSQYESGGDVASQHEFIELIREDDEFAAKWGELGPIYGKQWRNWETGFDEFERNEHTPIDQIKNLINELKTNPDSRRLLVSAWNVGELEEMTLPPCHYGFQCYTRELSYEERYTIWFRNNYETGMEPNIGNVPNFEDEYYVVTPKRALSLMWSQRSVDTGLGLPFNIASYATLLCLLADEVNMVPDEIIGNLGDVHLYNNHLGGAEEQIQRESFNLPTIEFSNVNILEGEFDYVVRDYKFHPSIKFPLSN